MSNARFLFVSALFAGNETYFQNLREAIAGREGVEATWLPIEREPREFLARVPPVSLNDTVKNSFVTRSRLRALEKSGKRFDAAFINHITPAYLLAYFMKRVPTLISMDATPTLLDAYSSWYGVRAGSSPSHPVERVKRSLAEGVYAKASMLLAWSSCVKKSLIRDYGIMDEKIRVVPPGIDLRLWGRPASRQTVRNGRRAPFRILFVGGDFLRKGGDLVLQLARREEFARCEFHIVTRSFGGDVPINTVVHADVKANSEKLRNLYRAADLFLFPTRADFSPLAVCEALAAGLPVVATHVGGLDEMVDDGVNGFLVPVDDEGALVERVRTLAGDRALAARMGRNARRTAETTFNLDRNAATLIDLLGSTASARASQDRWRIQ